MIAPAKLNLCLYLGGTRDDGLHELCSIFHPLTLADRVVVTESERDEVVCEQVDGENLAAAALAALREAGWEGPALRIEIEKRVPIAAGLGGGSADAAAVLRLAAGEVDDLELIAASLGADVPSQLDPRPALVTGAGEVLEPLPDPGEYAVVLVPDERGLSTPEVYAEADRLGLSRSEGDLELARDRILGAARSGVSPLAYPDLLVNDLGEAAVSLRPAIRSALEALEAAGAEATLISGSGPTAVGLFADIAKADAGAAALPHRYASSIVASPGSFL